MVNLKHIVCGSLATALVISCAHGAKRGSVAMKISDKEAHVTLGKFDVKAGDKLTLFKNECEKLGIDSAPICNKVLLGSAEVIRPLNEDYSVVHVEPGVQFTEDTIVETTRLAE